LCSDIDIEVKRLNAATAIKQNLFCVCFKLNISLISAKQHRGIVLKAGAARVYPLSEELVITQ
jgi:hypothetical protein